MARAGLRGILETASDIEVVAEAGDGAGAVEAARAHRPDIVLMDVRMPGMSGAEATSALLAHVDARVIAITSFDSEDYVFRMIESGASGFLLKDTAPLDIIQAVRTVAAGDSVVSPRSTAHLVRRFAATSGDAARRHAAERFATLTARERDVAVHVAGGATNDEIAAAMHLSVATVKTHLDQVRIKLGARNRALVCVLVERAGFGPPAL
ncbi:response regulator transcription factor [Microbacterium marinilacus]|nr:response regulator transcription factor [Microbacterium marinilacus]